MIDTQELCFKKVENEITHCLTDGNKKNNPPMMKLLFYVLIIPTTITLLVGVTIACTLAIPAFSIRSRSIVGGLQDALDMFVRILDFIVDG